MRPHLTAIASGKGGTGKTLVAVSLAQALAYAGERVLLVDADIGLANAGVHLGLGDTGDLPAFLEGRKPLAESVASALCGSRARFDLVGTPSGAASSLGEADAERLIATLHQAGGYDSVLIDLGAGVDPFVLGVAAHADEVLAVMTPDQASLTDAYAFVKLLRRRTTSRMPQIVVNMAANATEGRRIADALAASARAFLGSAPPYADFIPYDPKAALAVRRQQPLLATFPQTPAAVALERLARRLRVPTAQPLHAADLR